MLSVKLKVSPLIAPVADAVERRVGHPVGAAGVACGYRQGRLAYRQGAVDVDHGVVREVRTSRHRNDRIGSNRRGDRRGGALGEAEGVAVHRAGRRWR